MLRSKSTSKPSGLNTYVWYISPFQRFMARGVHQQAAFDALPVLQRITAVNSEFCVQVDSPKDINLPYLALLARSKRWQQHAIQAAKV